MSTSLSPASSAWHPRRWPYARMGFVLAVVTIGGSQVLFNVILGNRDHFPDGLLFHAWVLFWVQLLPAVVLFAADTWILRRAGSGDGQGARFWRSALYALTVVLFLRQAQVYHAKVFYAVVPTWAAIAVFPSAAAAVFFLSFRRPRVVDLYFSVLGILALILTAQYLSGTLWKGRAASAAPVVDEAPRPGPPVVLLVFDEWSLDTLLKDGKIDRTSFPRTAALADEGAWFPKATSSYAFTEPSTDTLLTGRRVPGDRDPSFFDRLRETHRATMLMAWQTCRERLASKYARPGDRYLSRVDAEVFRLGPLGVLKFLGVILSESMFVREDWSEPIVTPLTMLSLSDMWGSREMLDTEVSTFLGLLSKARSRGRFLYWHCSQTHAPFRYNAAGDVHGSSFDRFYGKGKEEADKVWEIYLDSARGVDRLIGLVVDRLKAEGLYEQTTLIVTSDHGIRTFGLMEPQGYPEVRNGRVVRIPFLLRGPSIRPGVYEAEYETLDFAPTILDVLGVPYAAGAFDGISAFRPERPEREPTFGSGDERYRLDRASGLWKRKRE